MEMLDKVQPQQGLFDNISEYKIPSETKIIVLTPDSCRHDLYLFCVEHYIKNTEGFIRGWFNADKILKKIPVNCTE